MNVLVYVLSLEEIIVWKKFFKVYIKNGINLNNIKFGFLFWYLIWLLVVNLKGGCKYKDLKLFVGIVRGLKICVWKLNISYRI